LASCPPHPSPTRSSSKRCAATCASRRIAAPSSIVDADGHRVVALGDVERPVLPRSAVKVLQAIPLVESGAAARLELDDEELAIACASHNGEPEHVAVVARMLAKAGLDEGALECGVHWPRVEPVARAIAAAGREPTALHNNCSGKHAGFLCLACCCATASACASTPRATSCRAIR
jgi:L-asparaginase II